MRIKNDGLGDGRMRRYIKNNMKQPITTLDTITADLKNLAFIEYVSDECVLSSEIVFVDQNGNSFEYDGICISEGKVKISIRPKETQSRFVGVSQYFQD
jgi:hypothetical protein